MLTRNEAERIANATCALRPSWNEAQVMGVLADPRIRERRTFADTARAMCWLATDEATRQPTRIFEHGPWWQQVGPREFNTSAHIPRASSDDCGICSRRPEACALDDSHEYEQINRRKPASAEIINAAKKAAKGSVSTDAA